MESRLNDATTFAPKNPAEGRGIPYFLPLVKLRITAIRTNILTSEDTGQTVMLTNVASSQTTITRWAKTNILVGTEVRTNAPFNLETGIIESKTNGFTRNAGTNGIEIVNVEDRTTTTQSTPLPLLKTNLSYGYAITIEEIIDRDPHHLGLFRFKPSSFSADQMQIQLTNGIVQAIAMTNDDKTLTALQNLVSAAAKIYSTLQSGGIAALGLKPGEETVQVIFDPFDASARSKASEKLASIGVTLNLDEFQQRTDSKLRETVTQVNGVFYRPFLPYTVGWKAAGKEYAQVVHLPNASPILHWDFDRALFVRQVAAVSFANGEPTTLSLDKPSQVEAFTQFPLNIANQLASLPTNLLQWKFDISTKQTQLVTQNNALVTATLQYLTNQAALEQRILALESNRTSTARASALTGAVKQPVQQ